MSTPSYQVDINLTKNEQGMIEFNNRTAPFLASGPNIELTCYEMACSPRVIENESELIFDMNKISRVVKEILKCTICHELFQEPVNNKSCLHKFCKKCIENYNRNFKKACAICRHSIENRRLTKEDERLKAIIASIIPDREKFNQDEEKEIQNCLPTSVFKDKERMENQIERSLKVKDIPIQESHNNITQSISNRDSNNQGNIMQVDTSNILPEINNAQGQTIHLLNKKTQRVNDFNQGFEGKNIEIKLNCDESEEDIKKYFQKTKLFLQDNFTLEFVSRYICYKQSFNADIINKIRFYTIDKHKQKVFWDQKSPLSQLRDISNNISSIDDNAFFQDEKIILFFMINY